MTKSIDTKGDFLLAKLRKGRALTGENLKEDISLDKNFLLDGDWIETIMPSFFMEKILFNREELKNIAESLSVDMVFARFMLEHPKLVSEYNLNHLSNIEKRTKNDPFFNFTNILFERKAFLIQNGYRKELEDLEKQFTEIIKTYEKETNLKNKN